MDLGWRERELKINYSNLFSLKIIINLFRESMLIQIIKVEIKTSFIWFPGKEKKKNEHFSSSISIQSIYWSKFLLTVSFIKQYREVLPFF